MPDIIRAANTMHACWQAGQLIDGLETDCRPTTAREAYAVQAALADLRAEAVVGWKIAATAAAGRAHINVDRPLAGRLFASAVANDGAAVRFGTNRMAVAEAEIVFTLDRDLPPQARPYTEEQLAPAIRSLHAGLEFPDSRFSDFTKVGTACLIADNACASQFVIGSPTDQPFSPEALPALATTLYINDVAVCHGLGRDALGGPLTALAWLVNTLSELGITLKASQFVTTGVTGTPSPVKVGDRVRVDLGRFGAVRATIV